jgi:hypothetical protein
MRPACLLLTLLGLCLWPPLASGADLARIDRRIGPEPKYQAKPKYALAVLGPQADFKVWLVLDGDVLYVDRNGNGDLTEPGEKVRGKKAKFRGLVFKAGDITVGKQTYSDLEVWVDTLKDYAESYRESPAYQKLLTADPEAAGYSVFVDVPLSRSIKDERGRPVTRLRHFVELEDANGFLQFAERPAAAPILHFGGPWAVWPREGQKFVLGRPEEFTTLIGTPGLGPGTLAAIQYHTRGDDVANFVPEDARPVLEAQFRGKEGRPVTGRYVLEDRC